MISAGIDIGGTAIKAGLADTERKALLRFGEILFPGGGAEKVCEEALALVRRLTEEEEAAGGQRPAALGVAVPGWVDPEGGSVTNAHNLGLCDVPLKTLLEARLPGLPVALENDGNAAALGELYAGALRGTKTAVLLTIGTGLGGGLILGGKLFRGGQGRGTEPGHMILAQGGLLCGCGVRGCAETCCSASWLAEQGRAYMKKTGAAGLLFQKTGGDPEKVDARAVIEAAAAGEPGAAEIFREYLENLSSLIASLTNLLDPELVALGGGVSQAGPVLYEPLVRLVQEKSFYKARYEILPAALGNRAGVMGAAFLGAESKSLR
ncbi:MAG: ROK family protein [Bacillota bacterium]|nr:ROK family protein [Bacillota bacterium]